MKLRRPKSRREWAASVVAALAVAGGLFYWVAPYNIAASVPHLPGVSWLLHTYMQNSVRTWSAGTERPAWADLGEPALVRLGARHFESGCRPCHGAPGRVPNPLVEGMRPAPPPLGDHVRKYKDRELHWLVLNGLKYTGMPAWAGEHRDDEPWAVAAFLRRYPELDPAAYVELAWGPSEPGEALAAPRAANFGSLTGWVDGPGDNCARCHGRDGLGRDGTAPKLAGQSEPYLRETLHAYAEGRRQSGFMEPLAAALLPGEIEALARHYARMPPFGAAAAQPSDPALHALGAELAGRGDDKVPSCLACHGERQGPERKPVYPRISGQTERWLTVWLELWRERDWGGTEYSHLMHAAARHLTDRQIAALAVFFAAGGGMSGESRN